MNAGKPGADLPTNFYDIKQVYHEKRPARRLPGGFPPGSEEARHIGEINRQRAAVTRPARLLRIREALTPHLPNTTRALFVATGGLGVRYTRFWRVLGELEAAGLLASRMHYGHGRGARRMWEAAP